MTLVAPSDEGRSRAFHVAVSLARHAVADRDARAWRWAVRNRSLDMYVDAPRAAGGGQLPLLGCGGALHLAGAALRAQGLDVWIERTNRPVTAAAPLARILVAGAETKPHPQALNQLRDRLDRMHRGTEPAGPSSPDADGRLVRACAAAGGRMRVLHCDEVMKLASIDATARALDEIAERVRDEVVEPQGHYAVLLVEDDSAAAWLRAGGAAAAVRLAAGDAKQPVELLTRPVGNPVTRMQLARLLGDGAMPAAVLRLGGDGAGWDAAAALFTSDLAGAGQRSVV